MGYQDFKLFSFAQIFGIILTAVFAIFLSYFGIYYTILGWCFGYFSLLIYWDFLSKKRIFKNSEKFEIKKIFWKYSLPMYLLNIVNSLPTVIIPLLSLFFSQLLIGYYSFAFMFYFAALLIPTALSSVLFPKISELNGIGKYDKAKSILVKTLSFYTLIVITGVAGCLLFSKWFIYLINPTYLPSLLIFRVLVSLGLFFGYLTIYNAYLSGMGKVKRITGVILLQNILLFIVSFGLLEL
jgi:O-antigen/teichoic acid export membrane protein